MSDKRQDIIKAANRAFYRDGFADVGIDRLVGEAGVALGTLYRHFKNRSEVVVGALEQRNTDFLNELDRDVAEHEGAEGVLRLFDVLGEWNAIRGGNGCFFLRAAADYPHDLAIRQAALSHKQKYLVLIERRLQQAGWSADQTKELAPAIFVLLEGAVAAAFALGDSAAVATARKVAAQILSSSGSSAS